jgi:hypothetical protein
MPSGRLSIIFFSDLTIFFTPKIHPTIQIDSIGSLTSYIPNVDDVKAFIMLKIKNVIVPVIVWSRAIDAFLSVYEIIANGDKLALIHVLAFGVSSNSNNLGSDKLGKSIVLCGLFLILLLIGGCFNFGIDLS